MRGIVTIICLLLSGISARTQVGTTFFGQKQAGLKQLLEQIAAYGTQLADLQEGYNTAKQGLAFITQSKKGDLLQHDNYRKRHYSVSSAVAAYPLVRTTIREQAAVAGSYTTLLRTLKSLSFPKDQRAYLEEFLLALWLRHQTDLEELKRLLTANIYSLGDGERLLRLEAACQSLSRNARFLSSFSIELLTLSQNRESMAREQKEIKKLY